MSFEGELVVHLECRPDFAFRHVLAFDIELLARDSSNSAFREVKGEFGAGVFAEVVVVVELVEILGTGHDVMAGFVSSEGSYPATFSLQGPRYQGLCRWVILVGIIDMFN